MKNLLLLWWLSAGATLCSCGLSSDERTGAPASNTAGRETPAFGAEDGNNIPGSDAEDKKNTNWVSLFNHADLEGWHALPGGKWEVKDGNIIGISPASEPRHGILLTDTEYDDFRLKVIYKAIKGNSGLYFRVEKVEEPVHVYGFQAEIDPEKDAGGLYETGGRGWVVKPGAEEVKKWYKPDEWNEMIVTAIGRDVTVEVNGYQTATLRNDPGRTKGYIGLQLHGGMEMEVLFSDVLIQTFHN